MKKCTLLLSAFFVAATSLQCNDIVGQTFYTIRPEFQSARPERVALWRYDAAKERDGGWCSGLQLVPFGSQSTNAKALGRYFMFGGKHELVVAGDLAFGANAVLVANPNLRDVNSEFFLGNSANVNSFKSTISFSPKHASVGAGLMWRQYLGSCCEKAQWWFEISSVLMNVRNDMNLKEEITQFASAPIGTTVGPQSMTEAFQGNGVLNISGSLAGQRTLQWNYGKIDGKRQLTNLSDIELKLGYDFCVCDNAHVEGYIGVVAPVAGRAKGTFVFEPIVGSGHVGVMFGSALGLDLWCCNDKTVRFEFEQNSRYLFKNTETRSFDLKGKPWSRYMLLVPSFDAAVAGGLGASALAINTLTQKLNVTPRFAHSINAAFVARRCNWESEVGINWWARQSEKVSLKRPWVEGPALQGLYQGTPPANTVINTAITINENFENVNLAITSASQTTYQNFDIKASDLDLTTAAHPAALSHTVYASMGTHFETCCSPAFLAVGGSYEFSGVNTALNRWMVWAKLGVSL
jgi:hypothetical protein